MSKNRPRRLPPLGPHRPQSPPRFPQQHGFWERLQRHYDENPKWGGSIDSRDYLPVTVLPRTSLVRVSHLPLGVSIAIHLSATSGNTAIGGPARAQTHGLKCTSETIADRATVTALLQDKKWSVVPVLKCLPYHLIPPEQITSSGPMRGSQWRPKT